MKEMEQFAGPISLKATEKDSLEAILTPSKKRYVLKPLQYPQLFELGKKAEASVWTVNEIDLSVDTVDWPLKLTEDERHYIKRVFGFFVGGEGVIIENSVHNMCSKIQVPEARYTYGWQIAIENVHSETYSMMIEKLVTDPRDQNQLFEAVDSIEPIKKKIAWGEKYMNPENSFAVNLVGAAIFEGLFFSAAFCSIFWLKKRGLMPGLAFSNELISRDEALHVIFSVMLYHLLEHTRIPDQDFYEILKEAVELEREFVLDALNVRLIGMNSSMMCQYVECVADRLSVMLGYEKIYNTKNPFDWMELISLDGKTNFFEKRVGEYQKANVISSDKNQAGNTFRRDEDF